MRLASKTALITGGNSGIGLATARLFAAEGARVAITGRNGATLDEARALLGRDAVVAQLDVTDLDAIEPVVRDIAGRLGKLDVLFANAGISGSTPLGHTSVATFERIVKTNLTAVFFTVQAASPYLNDGGAVILNGSVHAVIGAPGYAAYAAAKAGTRAMTRNLASDLAPRGIRVNQVTPAATRTPIWERVAPSADARAQLEQRFGRHSVFDRVGEADEVARAALFLATADASYVTGSEIVVDGGATSAPYGARLYRAG